MNNKIRIGIDFDNTIICYDNLFAEAVQEKGWNSPESLGLSKTLIKENLIRIDGNDFRWQELQAIVYGVLIKGAQPFPDCLETLAFFLSSNAFELFVVSHKTPRSNYLKEVTLIDKAIDWVEDKNIFHYIPKEHFYFLPTRDDKIQIIKNLKLDFFIDDLLEVLEDRNFPMIKKIYFSSDDPNSDWGSWAKIQHHFKVILELGKGQLSKIETFATSPFHGLETIKRNGNNKILRFIDKNHNNFIIKKYSTLASSYSTLEVEFSALTLLKKHDFPVPKPYFCDSESKLAIYGHVINNNEKPSLQNIIHDFSQFLVKLVKLSGNMHESDFAQARDSRTKIEDYKIHVVRRLEQIEEGCLADNRFTTIQTFINEKFKPIHEAVLKRYYENLAKFSLSETELIPQNQKILSPSDFGLHNSIWTPDSKFCFIDFEYFGWDDPVKLIADFLHHAGQNIEQEHRFEILKDFTEQAQLNQDFFKRLSTVVDLVGLEWILIILNVANPEVLQRRLYANPDLNVSELLGQRLLKAEERVDLFHTNIGSNSVFFSLKSVQSNFMGIPAWQQLIT